MDEVRDDVIGVWRVSRSGRAGGYVMAAVPARGALSAWLHVVRPGGTRQDERFGEVRRIADAQLSSGQPL